MVSMRVRIVTLDLKKQWRLSLPAVPRKGDQIHIASTPYKVLFEPVWQLYGTLNRGNSDLDLEEVRLYVEAFDTLGIIGR